ncbi:MAG TPA: DUF3108 domain-containing protein [Kofleriaceae bacterium]|nr:DUF3108 domain-containing protein [Kofleriaceae bacterium]
MSAVRYSIVMVVALAACGSKQGASTTTTAKPPDVASDTTGWKDAPIETRPQPQPPFVTPGERMTFNASIHGLDIATFGIAVGDLTDVGGKPAVVVQAGVQSSKMLSILKKIDDTFTTWIDVKTGRPLLFKGHELGGLDDPIIEDTDVDFSTAGSGTVKVALTRADSGSVTEVQEKTKEDLLDFQTFFLELRSWDAPVGAQLTADVLRSRYMWRTQLTVGGYENVVTQLGSLPAVRYDGVSRRLSRQGEIDMSQGDRHYSIWVSDDADRVPLLMVAKTDYGDVKMEIIDYAAGQGARLGTTWGGGKAKP